MKKETFVHALLAEIRQHDTHQLYQDIVLAVADEAVVFQAPQKQFIELSTSHTSDSVPFIRCTSWDLLYRILTGRAQLLDAFQENHIHMNGFLPQLFLLMILFQPSRATAIPE